jgi:taurine dioxygenase
MSNNTPAQRLTVKPVTRNIGAEISGIDLNAPIDDGVLEDVYQALVRHEVIFFRDQPLEPNAHMAFARSFGDPEPPHPVYPHVPGFENIVVLKTGVDNPPDTDGWHTDMTFRENPPFASILNAKEVPEFGGDTMWASMTAAYDALPEGMKRDLKDLAAVHDMGDFRNNFAEPGGSSQKLIEGMNRFGCAIHPVVRTHPVNGRKFLYVNRPFTEHIIDMTARESDRLLEYLYDHMDRPEFQVRFRWQTGSVAMWDNRVTQHYAVADYLPERRWMHRVTVIDDRRAQTAVAA